MKTAQRLIDVPTEVINIGIEIFYDDLKSQSVPVVQVDWHAPSKNEMKNRNLADLLADKLR